MDLNSSAVTFRNSCKIGKRNQPLFTLSVWRGQAPGSAGNAIAAAGRARGSLHKPTVKLAQRPGPECRCRGWKAPSPWTPRLLRWHSAALLKPAQPFVGCRGQDEPGEGQVLGASSGETASSRLWQRLKAGRGTVPSRNAVSVRAICHVLMSVGVFP